MGYKKVVVAGGGVLGSQIAFQAAYCGFDVTIWLRSEKSKTHTQPKLDKLKEDYVKDLELMNTKEGKAESNWSRGLADIDNFDYDKCIEKVQTAHTNIKLETDLKKAVEDADLVIESIGEDTKVKIDFYQKLAPLLPEKTVIVTNSSTLLPSTFAKYTGRGDKYLSLHFANTIWRKNTAEVMCHIGTDPKVFTDIIEFANEIRMVALPITKEKNGYLLNSMLVPFLLSAFDLYANGISTPETIDKAWTLGTGAPNGPFRIMDTVGLETVKNIVLQYQKVPGLFSPLLKKMMMPYNFKGMLDILNKYISEGKMGKSTKEGFYKYE
ncbi:MAG: 3-hydroxyacyl-CoA dehydrogenase [Bacilli bacterium]|nr:3-hydroxyacyl-CoA dehydrogenase [Bacilli bacterium]